MPSARHSLVSLNAPIVKRIMRIACLIPVILLLLPSVYAQYDEFDGIGPSSLGGERNIQNQFLDLFQWDRPIDSPCNGGDDFFQGGGTCEIPDMSAIAQMCSKHEFFYSLNPVHMQAVNEVKDLLMGQSSAADFVNMAGALREHQDMNPNVWVRAVVSASMLRNDMQGYHRPSLFEMMPNLFVSAQAMSQAKQIAKLEPAARQCVPVDETVGIENGIENLLWYFREDVMVNSHHWYWHLTYPLMGAKVRADRRGELFYAMHSSMIARYHVERLTAGLPRVIPLDLYEGMVIPDPYVSNLADTNSGRPYSNRPPWAVVHDVAAFANAEVGNMSVTVLERLLTIELIEEAILRGWLVAPNDRQLFLTPMDGVDVLSDVIEANNFNINPEYYGVRGPHNGGHFLIGFARDPRGPLIPPGVMAETATAMRDIVFYTYHTWMDNFYEKYKQTLPPYTPIGGDFPLLWKDVEIKNIQVLPHSGQVNKLKTFWGHRQYDLAHGLDFNRTAHAGSVLTCIKHLDHQEFEYEILINRKGYSSSGKATIRIFIAPRFNEKGLRLTMEAQRRLFFVLDTFAVNLKKGRNIILRKSTDSAVTIPWQQSLRELQRGNNRAMPSCGCGWPHHLLLPKGTKHGVTFDLFVMVSNGDEDIVPQPAGPQQDTKSSCWNAYLYCGNLNGKYPDRKPMRYPFDRLPYSIRDGHTKGSSGWMPMSRRVADLEEYMTGIPNMGAVQIQVFHDDGDAGGLGGPQQGNLAAYNTGPSGNPGGNGDVFVFEDDVFGGEALVNNVLGPSSKSEKWVPYPSEAPKPSQSTIKSKVLNN